MTSVKNTSSASETSEHPKRRIYVYTTPTNRLAGQIKVGMSEREEPGESGVRSRILEQFGTANSSKEYDLLFWCYTDIPDHELHRHPLLAPRRVSSNREWFKCDVDLVKRALNDIVNGVSRPDSYAMRPEQAACCDKAVSHFRAGGSRFLIDAKMRFGKTHTTYQIARALGMDRVLILTYKPAVEDSWREDLERHVAFDGMKFSRAEEGDQGPGVYFSSMQGIMSDDRSESERRSWIYDQDWDLIVFDEEHYGSRSERSMAIREALEPRTARWLFLSGTPFQARLSGEFSDDQVYTWSYVDEQQAKKSWTGPGPNPYTPLADMSFHTYDFSDRVKAANGKLYSEDEQFRMGKLFAATEKGFENPGAVGDFLDLIGGTSLQARQGQVSPWHSGKIERGMLNHTLWIMPPSVLSCRAMKKALRDHPFFSDFRVLNVAGDEDVTQLERLKREIATNDKTITLSVGRFTTGVTVPEWGAVFFLDDGRSPMGYYQAAFRSQSPWKMQVDAGGSVLQWKEQCYVVDFNPHRLLEMVYVVQAASRDKGQEDISESISSYLECAPIYRYGEVKPVELRAEDVLSVAINPHNFVEKFASGYTIDLTRADEEIVRALLDVDPLEAQSIRKVVTDTGVDRGKIKEAKTRAQREQEKEAKQALDRLRERAQAALYKIPSYLLVTELQETSCQDIIRRGDKEVFEEETGITIEQFSHMIRAGFLDEGHLDECIISFSMLEKSILGSADGSDLGPALGRLFDLISKLHMSGTETLTPLTLVDEMLDRLPPEIWQDPTKTFLDPSMGTGTFYMSLLQRLDRGLEDTLPDREERLRHIMSAQLFGCDVDRKQLRRFRAALRLLGLEQFECNVYNEDSLVREWNMKFDVVVGNPPYNPPVKKTGGSGGRTNLWMHFVRAAFNTWIRHGGYVAFVHPPTWRAPKSQLKKSRVDDLWEILTRLNQMLYLKIYNMSPFANVGTKADYYVVKATRARVKTTVIDCDGVENLIDMKEWNFLPHGKFSRIYSMLAKENEKKLNVVYSSTLYDPRAPYVSKERTDEYCYPILHATNKDGKRFFWSNMTSNGHFGVRKLMFGDSGINDVLFDRDGSYACSNHCIGIDVTDLTDEEALSFRDWLLSDETKNLLQMVNMSSFGISADFFTHLVQNCWHDK